MTFAERLRALELRMNRLACRLLGEHIFDRGRCACGATSLGVELNAIASKVRAAMMAVGVAMLPAVTEIVRAARMYADAAANLVRVVNDDGAGLEDLRRDVMPGKAESMTPGDDT